MKTIIYLVLFISFSCYGKRIYSMDKKDFTNQFNDSIALHKIYCYNEKGEKIWLNCNENFQLTIKLSNNKEYKLMLQTIRYKSGKIKASEYNAWWPSKKISSYDIDNVVSIKIINLAALFAEREVSYFDINNIKKILNLKMIR